MRMVINYLLILRKVAEKGISNKGIMDYLSQITIFAAQELKPVFVYERECRQSILTLIQTGNFFPTHHESKSLKALVIACPSAVLTPAVRS